MKNTIRTIAAAAALSLCVPALPAFAVPDAQEQEHRNGGDPQQQHPDYSNNSYYRTGNREGYQDYQKKQQRKNHNHKYRSNEDRSAHDYGYQQGWQGQRENDNRNNSNRANDNRNSNRPNNDDRRSNDNGNGH